MRRDHRPIFDLQLAVLVLTVFVVAFALRLYWVLEVQSPYKAVYSDMGGYVARATDLLNGRYTGDPRSAAFYPWGTHVLIAGEFALFGRKSLVGVGIVHAFVGALPAVCATLLTARLVPSRVYAGVAGFAVALWHPQITYVGFFMSELWFSAALMMSAWLVVRRLENARARGAIAAGVAVAVAFVVRPQVLLTGVFLAVLLVVANFRALLRALQGYSDRIIDWVSPRRFYRALVRPAARRWTLVLAPIVLAMVGSSVRLYHLSGRLGVISENDGVNRIFADTRIGKVEAWWTNAKGERFGAWYAPAMKLPLRDGDTVVYEGNIGDPVLLEKIRQNYVRGVPITKRIQRMLRNIQHLAWHAYPNPEEDFRGEQWRAFLQRFFANATLGLMPVGLIGVWDMRRRVAGLVIIANLVTIPVVAAFYFAEARHRVPYDPFLLIAATVGFAAIVRHSRYVLDHLRRRLAVSAFRR
jgi:hypothetical protein